MVAVKMSSLADNAGLTGTLDAPTFTAAVSVTGGTVLASSLAEGPGVSTSWASVKASVAWFGRSLWADFRLAMDLPLWADFRLAMDLSLRAELRRDDA